MLSSLRGLLILLAIFILVGCGGGATGVTPPSGPQISGVVARQDYSDPVVGAAVSVAEKSALTATDGSYIVRDAPPGAQSLKVIHPDFAPQEQTVNVGGQQTVDVSLRQFGSGSGYSIGQELGKAHGIVPVYYNGSVGNNSGPDCGMKYQCVQLIKRYYSSVFGYDACKWSLASAYMFDTNAADFELDRVDNSIGDAVPPQAGDIVVWPSSVGGGHGHVAIVGSITSDNKVLMYSQNTQANWDGWYAKLDKGGDQRYKLGTGSFAKVPPLSWLKPRISQFGAQWDSQAPHPTIQQGQSVAVGIKFKNTGKAYWLKSRTNLATDNPRDRQSRFYSGNWLSHARPTSLLEDSVKPGDIGTFNFTITAPRDLPPGTYDEAFAPVTEGVGWPNVGSVFIRVTVQGVAAPPPAQPDYDYEIVSQSSYPTVSRGGSAQFLLVVRNTGSKTWYRFGSSPISVNLGTDRPQDRVPGFAREDVLDRSPSGWVRENRVGMQEATVPPGATATFRFWMSALATKEPGVYREYFRPVADGVTWMKDLGIYWEVTVLGAADDYHAQWVTQNAYPTLNRNGCYRFVIQFLNTGRAIWHPSVVRLGTDRPQDRIPGYIREDRCSGQPSGWTHGNRVELQERSVAPGGTATFIFWYTVPPDKAFGSEREYFRPVAEDSVGFRRWMEDWGVYWGVTVVP